MPTINDRIGSQNVIRVLSNASAPPTRIVNLTDVDSTRKNEDGMLLVWNLSDEKFYMTDTLDAPGYYFSSASGITTFAGSTDSSSTTSGAIIVAGGIGIGKNLNIGNDLTVAGIATFSDEIDINAAVDILNGLNVAGITSVKSLSIGSTQVISSARELQNITSLDSTTTATIEEAIKVAPNTFTDLKISGISTFIGIATFGGGIAVQAGVSTFDVAVDINAGLDVDGQADLDEVVIAGVTTFNNADVVFQGASGSQNMTWDASANDLKFTDTARLQLGDSQDLEFWHGTNSHIKNSTNDLRIRSDSILLKRADDSEKYLEATVNADVKLFYNGNEKVATTAEGIDVTGRTETDLLNVTGIATFGAVDINGTIDIDGQLDVDELVVAGVATFSNTVDINGAIDADGGANIVGGSTLDQLNVTGVSTFAGISTHIGTLHAQTLKVAGVTTFVQDVQFPGAAYNILWDQATSKFKFDDGAQAVFGSASGGDLKLYHTGGNSTIKNETGQFRIAGNDLRLQTQDSSEDYLLAVDGGSVSIFFNDLKRLETSGIGVTVTGQLDSTTLNVTGVSTFSSLVDVNNRIDVVGGINGDQLYVAIATVTNTATFESAIVAESSLDVDGTTDLDVLNVAETATFSALIDANARLDVAGGANIDQLNVAGIATFGAVDINGIIDIDGQLDVDELVVSGVATFSSGVDINGSLDVDGDLQVDDLNVSGVSTFASLVDVNNRIDVVGGINVDQLNVTGVSTFGDDVTITAGGLNVISGIVTATELDIGTGGIDVDGQTDLDELGVAGIATFSTDVNITGLLTAGAIDGGAY